MVKASKAKWIVYHTKQLKKSLVNSNLKNGAKYRSDDDIVRVSNEFKPLLTENYIEDIK